MENSTRTQILPWLDDCVLLGLDIPRIPSNPLRSNITRITANQLPSLNNLDISFSRIDFAPYGVNPPHYQPHGSEVSVVLEDTVYAGFVTFNPDNRLFAKVLNKGDGIVFPSGLIHFQINLGQTNVVALAHFSSQDPGFIGIEKAVFGSNPHINPDVLTQAFQLDKNVVDYLEKLTWKRLVN